MKAFLCILFMLSSIYGISQEFNYPRLQLGADIGYSKIVVEEKLLNDYRYKGCNLIPIHLRVSFEDKDGFHFLAFHQQNAMLKPTKDMLYYNENKLRLLVYELSYNYLFRIKSHSNGLSLYAGFGYLGHFTHFTQTYENTLYYHARGNKYSYELSAGNLTGNLMLDYRKNKHLLRYKTGYGIANVTQRPDDYTVVSGFLVNNPYQILSINKCMDLDMSLQYHYAFNNRLSFFSEYFFRYLYYFDYPVSKSYKTFTTIGLTFKFF